ncbi:hypothetical protein KM043_001126 [Ampulex compressa]|nr:hypothetical protein KM043_001126 [Ampulex compressa]
MERRPLEARLRPGIPVSKGRPSKRRGRDLISSPALLAAAHCRRTAFAEGIIGGGAWRRAAFGCRHPRELMELSSGSASLARSLDDPLEEAPWEGSSFPLDCLALEIELSGLE